MNSGFCRRPVIIQAFQMTKERRNDNKDWPEWLNRSWNYDRGDVNAVYPTSEPTPDGERTTLTLNTVMYEKEIAWGDWIVQNEDGNLFVCSDAEFNRDFMLVILHDDPGDSDVQPVGS
jgi:hypothetical protein